MTPRPPARAWRHRSCNVRIFPGDGVNGGDAGATVRYSSEEGGRYLVTGLADGTARRAA